MYICRAKCGKEERVSTLCGHLRRREPHQPWPTSRGWSRSRCRRWLSLTEELDYPSRPRTVSCRTDPREHFGGLVDAAHLPWGRHRPSEARCRPRRGTGRLLHIWREEDMGLGTPDGLEEEQGTGAAFYKRAEQPLGVSATEGDVEG